MKKKLILLLGILALTAIPAVYSAAQGMDDPKDTDEAPGWQGGRHGGGMDKEAMAKPRGPGGREEMRGMKEGQDGPGFMTEDETLAVIKKNDPAFADKLADFKTAAPGKYKMIIGIGGKMLAGARFEQDVNMEKDAVRGLSLEFATKELGLKYDKAADADKPAIKADLKTKVAELFDLRLKGQEIRISRMEKELSRLKKNLENRKANKAKIVDERLEQLTGEGYGW